MKRFAFLFVILASAGFTVFGHVANMQEPTHARAQDTKKSPGEIRFPSAPIEVIPLPKPTPGAVLTLALDQLYVIDSDIPILLFDSPVGMVKWTKEAGPLKIRARFVGEEGIKTKTFAGKYIYSVEAKKTGAVELIVVPVGATEESAAIRRVLDVDAGEGPRPPPVPPGPDGEPILGKGGLRVLILYETGKVLPIKQHSIIHGKEVRDYLDAKCVPTVDGGKRGYYIVDQHTDFASESKVWHGGMARPRATVPWLVMSSDKGNYEGPLPADVSTMMDLLRKFGG